MSTLDVKIKDVRIFAQTRSSTKTTESSSKNLKTSHQTEGELNDVSRIEYTTTIYYADGSQEQLSTSTGGGYTVGTRTRGRDIRDVGSIDTVFQGPYGSAPIPNPETFAQLPVEGKQGDFAHGGVVFEGQQSPVGQSYTLVLTLKDTEGNPIGEAETFPNVKVEG